MTQLVIDRVNAMAADQPRLLTFMDQNGSEITDDDDDAHVTTPPETPHEIPGVIGDAAQITGVDKDVAIEEEIEDTYVENIGLENDLCNNPQPSTEAPNTTDYMTDNVPTSEHQPQTNESPTPPAKSETIPTTPIKPETPSKPQ